MADTEKKSKVNVVQRHQFADYLNVADAGADKPEWRLMGTGFTTLNESPSAQTETKKYVNEKSSTTTITSYETQFPFESDLISDEVCVTSLYDVARNHMVGADAQKDYVRVELWRPKKGSTTEFAARQFVVSVEVSEVSGETDMNVNGNLNAVGDPIDGYFNVSTKTFTASTENSSSSSSGGSSDPVSG